MIKCLSFFLVPSRSSSTTLYPPKVLRAREHVSNSLLFCCFHLRLTFESIKELGSASTSFANCNLELVLSPHAIMPLLEYVHTYIKFAQSCDNFMYDCIDDVKIC